MKEVEISEFKAKCARLLKEVQSTRKPIRVTYLGKPVAEIIPALIPVDDRGSWIGSMKRKIEILCDIVSPVSDPNEWD